MMYTLRFDVETLIIATWQLWLFCKSMLRFDVETLIIATMRSLACASCWLRFDVETLIIATDYRKGYPESCCGLM